MRSSYAARRQSATHWQRRRGSTSRRCSRDAERLGQRKIVRSDVAGNLVDAVDPMPPEGIGVVPDDLLAGRLVDAVRLHVAAPVDDHVAVVPRDLGKLVDRECSRAAPDVRHLILTDREAALYQEFRHGTNPTLSEET